MRRRIGRRVSWRGICELFKIEIKIKGVCLGADCFAFGDLLLKSTKSKQKCLLSVGPFVPQGSFTPVSLRGPAAIRHPWRGAALAASMPLGPLRETCVQPAPKSRLAVSGPSMYEDQKQIRGRLKASRLKPVLQSEPIPLTERAAVSGTGFSREGAGAGAINL